MTAHVVPLICSPLRDQAVQLDQESYEHLVDLELADCPAMHVLQLRSGYLDWK